MGPARAQRPAMCGNSARKVQFDSRRLCRQLYDDHVWQCHLSLPHRGAAAMSRADPIAYPPRGLSRDEAARYIGVGATKFDEMVKDGRMPKPKRLDGRTVWDRISI